MNMKECACGNDLLIQMMPQITNLNDFRVWKVGQECKATMLSSPVFLCPVCGRFELPHTSLSGKNRLDPEFQIYEKLLAVAKLHNDALVKKEEGDLLSTIKKQVEELNKHVASFDTFMDEVRAQLAESKEKPDVKTGTRGRKSTKPTAE